MGVYLSSKTEKGRDRKKGACPKERVEFTPTCVTFCCSPPKLFIRTEKGSLLWQAEDRLGERTQNFIAKEIRCAYIHLGLDFYQTQVRSLPCLVSQLLGKPNRSLKILKGKVCFLKVDFA